MCSSVWNGRIAVVDLARLAVPDQLDFTLITEEDEAVLVVEWFAGLDLFDQIALLGVSQLVGVRVKSRHARIQPWYSVNDPARSASVAGLCCSKLFWST